MPGYHFPTRALHVHALHHALVQPLKICATRHYSPLLAHHLANNHTAVLSRHTGLGVIVPAVASARAEEAVGHASWVHRQRRLARQYVYALHYPLPVCVHSAQNAHPYAVRTCRVRHLGNTGKLPVGGQHLAAAHIVVAHRRAAQQHRLTEVQITVIPQSHSPTHQPRTAHLSGIARRLGQLAPRLPHGVLQLLVVSFSKIRGHRGVRLFKLHLAAPRTHLLALALPDVDIRNGHVGHHACVVIAVALQPRQPATAAHHQIVAALHGLYFATAHRAKHSLAATQHAILGYQRLACFVGPAVDEIHLAVGHLWHHHSRCSHHSQRVFYLSQVQHQAGLSGLGVLSVPQLSRPLGFHFRLVVTRISLDVIALYHNSVCFSPFGRLVILILGAKLLTQPPSCQCHFLHRNHAFLLAFPPIDSPFSPHLPLNFSHLLIFL